MYHRINTLRRLHKRRVKSEVDWTTCEKYMNPNGCWYDKERVGDVCKTGYLSPITFLSIRPTFKLYKVLTSA